LHQQAWVARGKPGAFSNRYVYEFHLQLIRNRLASGEIQLLKISSGERLLGVLYNFVYRGRVYNYQSGIDYGHGHERSKPGFVMHSMAIEHCEKEGFTYYDLMAGDSQYKRSLGTRSNNLHWIVLQQRKCKFGFEDSLRRAKRLAFGSPVIA
jgi:CelD/BcsL family acetyltransferase involved in cellulose biosynthesis